MAESSHHCCLSEVEAERRDVERAWAYRKYQPVSFKETLQVLGVLVGLPMLCLATLFVGAQFGSWAGVFIAYGLLYFFIIRHLYDWPA